MLLLTRTEMQGADRSAIEGMGIPSLDLMERAGGGIAMAVKEFIEEGAGPVIITCGRGNNGGDGLVVARLLAGEGQDVQVWLAADPEELSGDAEVNWNRLLEEGPQLTGEVELLPMGSESMDVGALAREWGKATAVVDALLGTGAGGPPRPPIDTLITAMNLCGRPVVAVDIPSGVDADSGEVPGVATLATVTVTMAYPKLGLLLYPGREHAGRIQIVDIGIPPEAVERKGVSLELLDHRWALLRLPTRPHDSHKGHYGRVVAVAGSAGMMGAGHLVAASAYRAGAGLVRHAAPESLLAIAHGGRSEVMVTPVPDGGAGYFVPVETDVLKDAYRWADVVAIGPGLGMEEETGVFFSQALEHDDPELPLVIDADGLNHLAADGGLRKRWAGPVVITPHPGEAARLLKISIGNIQKDRVRAAVDLAETYGAVAVLKGAPTVIADGQRSAALCPLGNPGMASGGTGDVLTGVIAALIGQGLSPFSGAALGVYLHALAGDLATLDLGEWSMVAGDMVDYLPVAFGHIEAFPDREVLDAGVWT